MVSEIETKKMIEALQDELECSYWRKQITDNAENYEKIVKEDNSHTNAFVKINVPNKAHDTNTDASNTPSDFAQVLNGIPCGIKENIALTDEQLSCGSHILKGGSSPITATAVKQLLSDKVIPIGRTNMDEFAMGSDTSRSIYGRSSNPWDLDKTPGGSSGGSASAVSAGYVPFALGSDTGGSIRQPASFCGIWGLKPTYARVSRYGLVCYASSLDIIGIVAEHWKWLRVVFESIKLKTRDSQDFSSYAPEQKEIPSTTVKKVGLYIPNDINESVIKALQRAKQEYQKKGYEVVDIEFPYVQYSPAVYFTISTAEASANLARFDSIRYGQRSNSSHNFQELVEKSRSEGFGDEVKLRVLLGGFVLRSGFRDQYYAKAQQLRSYITQQISKLFETLDLIALPVFPTAAFRFGEQDEMQKKIGDAYSTIANLTGMPAVSTPISYENDIPIGMQLIAPHYGENRLFSFLDDTAECFEFKRCERAKNIFKATRRKETL